MGSLGLSFRPVGVQPPPLVTFDPTFLLSFEFRVVVTQSPWSSGNPSPHHVYWRVPVSETAIRLNRSLQTERRKIDPLDLVHLRVKTRSQRSRRITPIYEESLQGSYFSRLLMFHESCLGSCNLCTLFKSKVMVNNPTLLLRDEEDEDLTSPLNLE